MTLKEQLLRDAKGFCEFRGISLSRLGTIVANNGNFFVNLESGGDCTTGTLEKFQTYFREHWPDYEAATSDAA